MESYDLIVIGGGPGGYEAARRAAELGGHVALVEARELGGTCLNRGCIPTKCMLHSAKLLRQAAGGEAFGVLCGEVRLDAGRMYEYRDRTVKTLRDGMERQAAAGHIAVYRGWGRLETGHTVSVRKDGEEAQLTGIHVLLAAGSSPVRLPIEGADLPEVLTSDELLTGYPPLYASLIIIGGGVIGIEFASFYAAVGCRVTILEAQDRILPTLDRELAQGIAASLKKRGVEICTGAVVRRLSSRDGGGVVCLWEDKGTQKTLEGEAVLMAAGRRPNLEGLAVPGVPLRTERGFVEVDDCFQTSISGVYAIGDLVRGPALAHTASAQGITAVEHMFGLPPSIRWNAVPSCVYTSPEIASVGMTADEARVQGRAVKTGKALMTANGKSVLSGAERGIIKLVFDGETEVLLGAQLLCDRATDMVDALSTAVSAGLTRGELLRVIRPHPTYCEAVNDALAAVR